VLQRADDAEHRAFARVRLVENRRDRRFAVLLNRDHVGEHRRRGGDDAPEEEVGLRPAKTR